MKIAEILRNEKTKYRVYLNGLILFHMINFLIWIVSHKAYPLWDEGMHLQLILRYLNFFKAGSFNLFDLLAISDYYPPLYHLSCIPMVAIMGFNPSSVLIMNFIYGMVGLIFLFKVGKELKDEEFGFWITLIFSFYFFWNFMLRITLIDAALTTLIIVAFYLFLKANDFKDRKYTILFAIVSGLGMLTKWSFLFYILIPVLITKFKIFRELRDQFIEHRRGRIVPFIIWNFLLIISIISLFFYQWMFMFIPLIFIVLFSYLIFKMTKENALNLKNLYNFYLFILVLVMVAPTAALPNLGSAPGF